MATKKRAHVCNQEEEEEEKKMEQFFALLRNFHEALNRRKEELRQQQQKDAKIRKTQSSWVPAFEWADFNEEMEFQRPTPCNNRKQEERDDGLDLSLTL
ncbi:hypothetical protein V6N13_079263 [Hibiscus sabdariffa]|uniref:Protein NIM1-INTERACTING 1 n=1 Tax=Hibiscus sabdariffa TaxID=183260 RepID=A0ABR2RQW8_9ROSI